MAMLDDVKHSLRISAGNTKFDSEVQDLIDAAIADLGLSGVSKAEHEDDPLIKRAIIAYCKAHFGWDNPDHDRLVKAYDMLKAHFRSAKAYSEGD